MQWLTKVGPGFDAVGGKEEAARFAGTKTGRVVILSVRFAWRLPCFAAALGGALCRVRRGP